MAVVLQGAKVCVFGSSMHSVCHGFSFCDCSRGIHQLPAVAGHAVSLTASCFVCSKRNINTSRSSTHSVCHGFSFSVCSYRIHQLPAVAENAAGGGAGQSAQRGHGPQNHEIVSAFVSSLTLSAQILSRAGPWDPVARICENTTETCQKCLSTHPTHFQ